MLPFSKLRSVDPNFCTATYFLQLPNIAITQIPPYFFTSSSSFSPSISISCCALTEKFNATQYFVAGKTSDELFLYYRLSAPFAEFYSVASAESVMQFLFSFLFDFRLICIICGLVYQSYAYTACVWLLLISYN